MVISGINGSNFIPAGTARLRVKEGWIDGASIVKNDDGFNVYFTGKNSEWDGSPLVLSGSGEPYKPRNFKSMNDAILELIRIGIHKINGGDNLEISN